MGESSARRRPTHDTNTSRRQVNTHTHQHQQQQQQQHFSKYKHTMKFTGLIASTLMLLLAVMASTASARGITVCCRAYNANCMSCNKGVSVEEFCRTDPTFPGCPIEQPPICCNAYSAKCEACKQGLSEEEFCRKYPTFSGCPPQTTPTPVCCNAYNAECEACKFGITVEEMCRVHEEDMAFDSHLQPLEGCPKKPKPCCRANTLECQACNAGVSEDEFCRRNPHSHVCPQKPTKPSHPDNCYSTIWNTEIMHGEMGAKKCCWDGDWKKKSKCEKKTSHPDNCYSTIWNKEVMHGEMGAKKCCWKGDWESKSKCK